MQELGGGGGEGAWRANGCGVCDGRGSYRSRKDKGQGTLSHGIGKKYPCELMVS